MLHRYFDKEQLICCFFHEWNLPKEIGKWFFFLCTFFIECNRAWEIDHLTRMNLILFGRLVSIWVDQHLVREFLSWEHLESPKWWRRESRKVLHWFGKTCEERADTSLLGLAIRSFRTSLERDGCLYRDKDFFWFQSTK